MVKVPIVVADVRRVASYGTVLEPCLVPRDKFLLVVVQQCGQALTG